MPRNGSGVYSLPGTYEAVSGETIEAQQHNDPLEDLQQDANTPRPVVAGGTGSATEQGAIDAFFATARTIKDDKLLIVDPSDTTKRARLDAGNVTAGQTRVISLPDQNLDLRNLAVKGTAVASGATVTLGAGNFFHITGTTTITDIDFTDAYDGRWAILEFDGALTLTHNATTLVLPGRADITTAAGDICLIVQDSGDNVHVVSYQPAASLQRTLRGSMQSLLSGSQVDFAIPSWAKWVEINFHNTSSSASGNLIVQIGGSGGIETSGYSGSVNVGGTPAALTSSFVLIGTSGATAVTSGSLRLSSLDVDTWAATWQSGFSNSAGVNNGAGSKVISAGALTTVRFATTGTAFDNGVVNVLYGG